MEAGERAEDGEFPPDTVNARVEARLIGFFERLRALRADKDKAGAVDGKGSESDDGAPP
jgi:hypothetical protein